MKIKKTQTYSKKIMIAAIVLILALSAGGVFFYLNRHTPNTSNKGTEKGLNTVDYGPASDDQKEATKQLNDSQKTGSDPLPDPTPQAGGKSIVDVAITSVNQDSSNLKISALISAIDSSGACTLTLSKNEVTIQRKADTQALPSSSTCKGFSVPVSEMSPGQWQMTLVYEGNSLTGKVSQIVEVR